MESLIRRLNFNAGAARAILFAVPMFAKMAMPGLVDSVNKVIEEMEAIAKELEQLNNGNKK